MKYSIVVPLYNSGRYLKEALDSLLSQEHRDFEALLVYDPSNDDTLAIAESFEKKDERFKLIRNPERLGISGSRFQGVRKATGDYVLFLDGDDYYKPNLLYFLEKNGKDADVVAFSYMVSENGKERPAHLKTSGEFLGLKGLETLLRDMGIRGFLWNKAIKRDLFYGENLVNPVSMQGGVGEDMMFLIPVFYRAKKVVSYKERLYGYRQYEEGLSKVHKGDRAYHHLLFWELAGAFLLKQGEEAYKIYKGAAARFGLSLGYDLSFDKTSDKEAYKAYVNSVREEWKSVKEKGPFTGPLYQGIGLEDALVVF